MTSGTGAFHLFLLMAADTARCIPVPVHGLLQGYPGSLFLARHRMTVGASLQARMVANTTCVVICLMGLVIEGNPVHANGWGIRIRRSSRSDEHTIGLTNLYARYLG